MYIYIDGTVAKANYVYYHGNVQQQKLIYTTTSQNNIMRQQKYNYFDNTSSLFIYTRDSIKNNSCAYFLKIKVGSMII